MSTSQLRTAGRAGAGHGLPGRAPECGRAPRSILHRAHRDRHRRRPWHRSGAEPLFVDAGAATCVADIDEAALAEVIAGPLATGIPVVLDVSNAQSAAAAVEHVVERTGRLDILVNNAGIFRDRMVWKLSDDDWEAVLAVHLTGTFNMHAAAVPVMREQNYGRIVNVTSYTGLHGNIGQANYAAAKAGIIGFTLTTAKELAGFGITVNAISPNARHRHGRVDSGRPTRRAGSRTSRWDGSPIPPRRSRPSASSPASRPDTSRASCSRSTGVVDLTSRRELTPRTRAPARSIGRSAAVARRAVG